MYLSTFWIQDMGIIETVLVGHAWGYKFFTAIWCQTFSLSGQSMSSKHGYRHLRAAFPDEAA